MAEHTQYEERCIQGLMCQCMLAMRGSRDVNVPIEITLFDICSENRRPLFGDHGPDVRIFSRGQKGSRARINADALLGWLVRDPLKVLDYVRATPLSTASPYRVTVAYDTEILTGPNDLVFAKTMLENHAPPVITPEDAERDAFLAFKDRQLQRMRRSRKFRDDSARRHINRAISRIIIPR